jgi:RNA polymerase sigma-70 factor (ECF subfamily)
VSTNDVQEWAGRLYDQQAAQLVLYGRALGLSHAEAEDVLHETFRALLVLGARPEQPEHYLVRSVRNRALNYRRGWWRRLARELEARRWFEPAEPEDPLESRLADALAGLPQSQREVIVLKIWHRLTFGAIGQLLACSPHTAAGRFRYGLVRLRRLLTGVPGWDSPEAWESGVVPGRPGGGPPRREPAPDSSPSADAIPAAPPLPAACLSAPHPSFAP